MVNSSTYVTPLLGIPGIGVLQADDGKIDCHRGVMREMAQIWTLNSALLGGTSRMREEASVWLPRFEREDYRDWVARVAMSFLYPGFEDAVEKLSAIPFTEPITFSGAETLDPVLKNFLRDVSGGYTDITAFSKKLTFYALAYGVCCCLLYYPRPEGNLTVQQVSDLGLRPYATIVEPSNLLEVDYYMGVNGLQLSYARVLFWESVVNAEGTRVRLRVVREYTPTTIREHREKLANSRDYEVVSFIAHGYGEVPLLVLPFQEECGKFKSPLQRVAELNLCLFQSESDQRHILHVARVPLIFYKGASDAQADPTDPSHAKEQIIFAANSVVATTNTAADMKYVEHSGAAIKSGEADVASLKADIAALSLVPVTAKTSYKTAQEVDKDEATQGSPLKQFCRRIEALISHMLGLQAVIIGKPKPVEVTAVVRKDFAVPIRSAQDQQTINYAFDKGLIRATTWVEEMQRRDVVSATVKAPEETIAGWQEHLKRTKETTAAMATQLGGPDKGNDKGGQPPSNTN